MLDLNDPKYEPAAIRARQNSMMAVTISMTLVGGAYVCRERQIYHTDTFAL